MQKSLEFSPDPLKADPLKVLVSGGSSGIGKAIVKELKDSGYKVFRISRYKGEIVCDLRDEKVLEQKIKKFLSENDVDLLINCAGIGEFKPHEEINFKKICEIIDVNLKAPILLTNLCLRSLKKTKGHIINISSIEALRHSKFSALYTATKSGLRDFSLSLFEEVRKSGVRVTSVNPDLVKTDFFKNLNFEPKDNKEYFIEAQELAKTILHIINSPSPITDLTIRPQKIGIIKKNLTQN